MFLRQDYAYKELLVLNDCPGQELICDAPDVFVINFPRRFRTLGEKLNAGIALAEGSIIVPWNDDDIMLPWRITKSLERLADTGYYNPQVYWFLDSSGLHNDHQWALATTARCLPVLPSIWWMDIPIPVGMKI